MEDKRKIDWRTEGLEDWRTREQLNWRTEGLEDKRTIELEN